MNNTYQLEGLKQSLSLTFGIGIPFPTTIVTFILVYRHLPSLITALVGGLILLLSGLIAYYVIKKVAVRYYTITIQEASVAIQMEGFQVRRNWQFTFDRIRRYRIFRYGGTQIDIWLQNGQRIHIIVNDTFNNERDLEPFLEHLAQGVEQYHPQAASTRKATFLEKPIALYVGGIITLAYFTCIFLWIAQTITISYPANLLMVSGILVIYWVSVVRSRIDAKKDARSSS